MSIKDDKFGGGFAEVRDGETITPVIRPPDESVDPKTTPTRKAEGLLRNGGTA